MPRGIDRPNKPTREELTARLLEQREIKRGRANARAAVADERATRRHVAQSGLPSNDSWSTLPLAARQRKLARARKHSEKLKGRLFQMFDATEQIDARIEELEQLE